MANAPGRDASFSSARKTIEPSCAPLYSEGRASPGKRPSLTYCQQTEGYKGAESQTSGLPVIRPELGVADTERCLSATLCMYWLGTFPTPNAYSL